MKNRLQDSDANDAVVRSFPRAGAPADQVPPEVRDVVDLVHDACGRDLVSAVVMC